MSIFRKRNLLVGIAAFVVGVGAFAVIWGVPGFLRRNTTTQGQVTAYLLDDRGAVNGLLISNGDQIHFSSQTGEAVASQIKVGDAVTATGHAGSKSSYGRDVEVARISANGRTIMEAESGRRHPGGPRELRDRRGPKGPGERPGPSESRGPREAGPEPNAAARDQRWTEETENMPMEQPNVLKVAGTIKTHLVNHHGVVDGLILSNGEQIRFSPRVGKLVIAAEQGAATEVNAEGPGVTNEHGTVLRPDQITIGNQTIALGR
ncbi:MAG: hypothetical protein QOH96_1944 [Blastocatellia bacterium]|nr:hypothetical protein [Blastocatellia bacterium]